MTDPYLTFVSRKLTRVPSTGLRDVPPLSDHLFPFQRDLVTWALRRGRCALFADTGLGKTRMQVEWAKHVTAYTGRPTLILAPLSVARQTADEAAKVDVRVRRVSDGSEVTESGIYVTNYDRLHRFEGVDLGAVVLDESSIIKHHDSKTLATLLERFTETPYKLACSATPSPNDYTELGTHAEFLGVCTRSEMLAEFFVHDGGDTSKWRLKRHARVMFWRWVAGWAAMVRRPSDLGHESDDGYNLPPLHVHEHVSKADPEQVKQQGLLFAEPASTLTERRAARRDSMSDRVAQCVAKVTECTCGLSSNGKSTSEPITSARSTSGRRGRKNNARATTPTETGDTPETLNDNAERDRPHETGPETTRTGDWPSASNPTGSRSNNTGPCSPSREADAPSADVTGTLTGTDSSASSSTTAMQQAEFAASSAHHATSGSASSETIPGDSSEPRCTCAASKRWIVWAELNAEQEALGRAFDDQCVSITGSMTTLEKEILMQRFLSGDVRILLSKVKICGFGVNLQLASNMAFVGVTDSWESYYQATRRIWRFGQKRDCHVHIFCSELEGDVLANLKRKGEDARRMGDELSAETRDMVREEIYGQVRQSNEYAARTVRVAEWVGKREAEYEV